MTKGEVRKAWIERYELDQHKMQMLEGYKGDDIEDHLIDPNYSHDWESLVFGYCLGCGLSLKESVELTQELRLTGYM